MSREAGFDDLTPHLSEAEKVWRCRNCGLEQDSSGPVSSPSSPVTPSPEIENLLDVFHIAAQKLNLPPELIHNAVTGTALTRQYYAARSSLLKYVSDRMLTPEEARKVEGMAVFCYEKPVSEEVQSLIAKARLRSKDDR